MGLGGMGVFTRRVQITRPRRAIMSTPYNAGMTILLAGTVFYHIQLGLQVVIEDYVHIAALEFVLLLYWYVLPVLLHF